MFPISIFSKCKCFLTTMFPMYVSNLHRARKPNIQNFENGNKSIPELCRQLVHWILANQFWKLRSSIHVLWLLLVSFPMSVDGMKTPARECRPQMDRSLPVSIMLVWHHFWFFSLLNYKYINSSCLSIYSLGRGFHSWNSPYMFCGQCI